jgi:hypothetical protein
MTDEHAAFPKAEESAPQDAAVWVKYFNVFLPVSRVSGGKQQLLNEEPEWYYEIQKRLGADYEPKGAVIHDTRGMYTGSAQNPYDNPLADGSWLPGALGDAIAVSGDWEPFAVKVRYECYTLQSQPENTVWSDYFSTRIAQVSGSTPLVVKDAWFFDIDGDGGRKVSSTQAIYHPCKRAFTAAAGRGGYRRLYPDGLF